MKKNLLTILLVVFSSQVFGMTLTKDFVATRLKYNNEKKYYDVDFLNQAGIYNADDKFLKCLQKSISSKTAAKVTFDPMGLKIVGCEIKY